MTIEQVRPKEINPALLPVGAALRAKREQLGWSLPDVAAWLRIKLAYLEALEGGQVAKLPGTAYAFGFLRAYSGVLGLDADDMSRRFRNETKDVSRRPELSFPAPVPERGVPAGAVVLLGVVVVGAAYAGWYEFSGHERRIAHVVPPVPAALSSYAGPIGPATPSPQVATVMPGPGQTPSALPQAAAGQNAAPSAVAGKVPAVPNGVPAASVPATGAVASPTAASSGPAAGPGSTVPVATAPAAGPAVVPAAAGALLGQITVSAVGTSWVQVRQPGGRVLYDHVLKPGETWQVPPDAGALTLSTGNAGAVTLSVDGVTSPVLGRIGAVRRAIPLDAASIKDGSVAADAAPVGPVSATLPDGQAGHDRPARRRLGGSSSAEPADATDRLNERQLDRTGPH